MEEEIVEFTPNEYTRISEYLQLIYELRDGQPNALLEDFIGALESGSTIVMVDGDDEEDETFNLFGT